MSCERYRETLSDVAAGLPASTELEAHLASCGSCRSELEGLRTALHVAEATLAEIAALEPSSGLRARIRADAEAAAEPRGVRAMAWRWVWASSGALVLAVLAASVWRAAWLAGPPGTTGGKAGEAPSLVASARTDAGTSRSPSPVPTTARPRAAGDSHPRPRTIARHGAKPEVIVPPGQELAIVRFAEALRLGAVEAGSLLVADAPAPLQELPQIQLAPIEIVPLDASQTSGL